MDKFVEKKNKKTGPDQLSSVYWNRILDLSSSKTQQVVRAVSSTWQENVKRYCATCPVSLDFNTVRKLSSSSSSSSTAVIPGVCSQAEAIFPIEAQRRLLHECARPDKIKLTYGYDNWEAVNQLICTNPNNAEVKEIDFQIKVSESLLPLADQLNQPATGADESVDEKAEEKTNPSVVSMINGTLNRMPKLRTLNIIAMNTCAFPASNYGETVEKNASMDVRFWPLFAQLTTLTVRAEHLPCYFYPEILTRLRKLKLSLLLRSFKLWIAIGYRPDLLETGRFLSVCPLLEEFELMVEDYFGCSQHLLPTLEKFHNLRRLVFLPFAFTASHNYSGSICYFMEKLSQHCSQLTTIEIHKRPGSTHHNFLKPFKDAESHLHEMRQMSNLQKLVLDFGGNEATSIDFICGILPFCRGLLELECPLSMEECSNTVGSDRNFKKIFFALAALPLLRKLTLHFIYSDCKYNTPSKFYFMENRTAFLDKIRAIFARTSPGLELTFSTTKVPLAK